MRRRVATVLSALVLGAAVLPAPALAADAGTVVLATEAGEGGEAPGPVPRGPAESENEFAPAEYEPNWSAVLAAPALFALILGAAVAIGLGYWVRVGRFSRDARQS